MSNFVLYTIATGAVVRLCLTVPPVERDDQKQPTQAVHTLTDADKAKLPAGGPFEIQGGALVKVAAAPKVVTLSKRKIRLALREMGKESAFDAFLDQSGARPDCTGAQVIMTDDLLFTTYAPSEPLLAAPGGA